jgi:hypothetical protein
MQCNQHGMHVHVAQVRRMRTLIELPSTRPFHVSAMGEVNASARAKAGGHARKIVRRIRAKRSRAERHAVCGNVDQSRDAI